MQGGSKAAAPAGTPLEEYRDLKRLSDTLRENHLGDSAAGSRYSNVSCRLRRLMHFTPTVSTTLALVQYHPLGCCIGAHFHLEMV